MDTARLSWLLFAVFTSVVAQEPLYYAVGSDLMLKPQSPPPQIDRVVWKHGVNLLADVTRGKFNSYGPFKCCTTLENDGTLSIKGIQRAHAGEYSVEVNNQVQDQKYDVRVINRLTQPKVRATPLTCSSASESCVIVCEVNATEAGPVKYTWFFGDEKSPETSRDLTIKRSDEPPTYACQVENPVSQEKSEDRKNPLISPPPPPPYWAVVPVLLVIGLLGVVGYMKREFIRKRFCEGRDDAQPGPTETPSPESRPFNSNGPSADEGADADAEANANSNTNL